MVIAGFSPGMVRKPCQQWAFNYQPQLFFTPDFWTINSMLSEIRGSWWFQCYMVSKRWWSFKILKDCLAMPCLILGRPPWQDAPGICFLLTFERCSYFYFFWLATLLHNVALERWFLSNFETSLFYHYSDSSFPKKSCKKKLGGGFKYFLHLHPYLGKWSILTSIFFKWVGSTTNRKTWDERTTVEWPDSSRWAVRLWQIG